MCDFCGKATHISQRSPRRKVRDEHLRISETMGPIKPATDGSVVSSVAVKVQITPPTELPPDTSPARVEGVKRSLGDDFEQASSSPAHNGSVSHGGGRASMLEVPSAASQIRPASVEIEGCHARRSSESGYLLGLIRPASVSFKDEPVDQDDCVSYASGDEEDTRITPRIDSPADSLMVIQTQQVGC